MKSKSIKCAFVSSISELCTQSPFRETIRQPKVILGDFEKSKVFGRKGQRRLVLASWERPLRNAVFDQERYDTNCPPFLYSPDLNPSNFFHTSKRDINEKRLATVEEVKQKSLEVIKNIPINEFKNCFEQWTDSLEKCVVVKGEYFDGDQKLMSKC